MTAWSGIASYAVGFGITHHFNFLDRFDISADDRDGGRWRSDRRPAEKRRFLEAAVRHVDGRPSALPYRVTSRYCLPLQRETHSFTRILQTRDRRG